MTPKHAVIQMKFQNCPNSQAHLCLSLDFSVENVNTKIICYISNVNTKIIFYINNVNTKLLQANSMFMTIQLLEIQAHF